MVTDGQAWTAVPLCGSRPNSGVNENGRRFLSRPPSHEKEPTPVSKRVTPSERLRAEVDEVFAGGADLATAVEEVARIGARLLTGDRDRDRGHRVPAPRALRPRRDLRGRPRGQPQRLLRHHDQDHRRAGHTQAPEAARHHRGLRLPAAGDRGEEDPRAGEPGHRRVRPRPLDPGRGGHPGRGPRRGGHRVALDGVADRSLRPLIYTARETRPLCEGRGVGGYQPPR